jgi:hypothetical protein
MRSFVQSVAEFDRQKKSRSKVRAAFSLLAKAFGVFFILVASRGHRPWWVSLGLLCYRKSSGSFWDRRYAVI